MLIQRNKEKIMSILNLNVSFLVVKKSFHPDRLITNKKIVPFLTIGFSHSTLME